MIAYLLSDLLQVGFIGFKAEIVISEQRLRHQPSGLEWEVSRSNYPKIIQLFVIGKSLLSKEGKYYGGREIGTERRAIKDLLGERGECPSPFFLGLINNLESSLVKDDFGN